MLINRIAPQFIHLYNKLFIVLINSIVPQFINVYIKLFIVLINRIVTQFIKVYIIAHYKSDIVLNYIIYCVN